MYDYRQEQCLEGNEANYCIGSIDKKTQQQQQQQQTKTKQKKAVRLEDIIFNKQLAY